MSAFLTEDKSISKIANKVYSSKSDLEYYQRKLKEIGINNAEELGKAMYKLNCEALVQRYNDKEFRDFEFTFQVNHRTISIFKSLECFMYQCSEGDVPEKKLFKILTDLELTLAKNIIRELPEYDEYGWN